MAIPSISYEAFSTSNQGLAIDQGPWNVQSDPPSFTQYEDVTTSWCDSLCLSYRVYPGYGLSTWQASFVTNISVNLADYGGATSLDFALDYWPLYCGSNTTTGSGIPITSQVGDATFDESFPSVNYTTFFYGPNGGHVWDTASKISHSGSTRVVRGSDQNLGYIAIQIGVTRTYSVQNEYVNFYIKDIQFLINPPTQSASASSSSATSTPQVDGSSAPSSSSTAPAGVAASSATPPAGVVIGAVVGTIAFVALFILAVWLFRRRHKEEKNPVDNPFIYIKPANHEAPAPMEEGPSPPSHLVASYPAQPTSPASLRPTSVFSHGSYGPPPIYRPHELTGQDRPPLTPSSPELARFAAANREAINDNLEARLQAAGYVPTQDPSRLTPEVWKHEYGITRLELDRLQNLYERTQQDRRQ